MNWNNIFIAFGIYITINMAIAMILHFILNKQQSDDNR
jgi:hypothetical protein